MSEPAAALPPVNMLWIGDRLGLIGRLSIVSYLGVGHPVRLHVYDHLPDVPDGVELCDAALTAPRELMMSLRSRRNSSFATASDYFRLLLLQRAAGLWSDTDAVCLRPIPLKQRGVFGWESYSSMGSGILYLPPGSPVLDGLLAQFKPWGAPNWLPPRKRAEVLARRLLRMPYGPADLRRGTFGPVGLTAVVRAHRLQHHAEAVDVFYPYPHARAAEMFEPGSSFDDDLTADTKSVHLWNEMLKDVRDRRPPGTSAIGRLLTRFGL